MVPGSGLGCGFGVLGFGFGVLGFGLRVSGVEFGVLIWELRLVVQCVGFIVHFVH